ncbi:MAG: hypothetical protein ACI85F_000664 [Bacteroidia bacterium]|jgi:hypothetical protein
MKDSVRKEVLEQLISLDEAVVNKALDKVRKSGDHTFVGPLMQRLITGDNTLVHAMVLQLFHDLKDKPSIDILIDELVDAKFDELRPKLLECVWQSGIDVRHRLDSIIDINLKGDFLVCLETLTIVENFEPGIDNEILDRNIEKMKSHMLEDADTSDELRLSLIEVLENFKIG